MNRKRFSVVSTWCLVAVLVFATVLSVQAQRSDKATPAQQPQQEISPQALILDACTICFTCGGEWPRFQGSIRSVGDFPTERGGGCGGGLIGRNDTSPFLCCK
jgi:hypothetical protein